eukprot:TRINITY_DN34085_c0_g1_i1.p1 TRINITY_DN34085_c0_g1~~TRINITY_DN34085_c0_g1_i1.p1  ORF type:complete len:699 (-),score=118.14 TRINITY_DN34085_c0_g1_i1:58-1953(-)
MPVVMSCIMSGSVGLICILLSGFFLSPADIAIVGLGTSLVNIFARSIYVGFGVGTLPLLAQARGANNKERFSVVAARLMIVFLALMPGMAACFCLSGPILRFIGQPEVIVVGVSKLMLIRLPGIFFIGIAVFLFRVLGPLLLLRPITLGSVATLLVLVPSVPAVLAAGLGIEAIGWCLNLADAALMSVTLVMAYRSPRFHEGYLTVPRLRDVIRPGGMWELISSGLTAGVSIHCEWWAGEALLLFAGLMGVAEAAAMAALYAIAVSSFMSPLGFSAGGSVVLGRTLGANGPRPRALAIVAFLSCVGSGAVMSLIMGVLAPLWIPIFAGRNHDVTSFTPTAAPAFVPMMPALMGNTAAPPSALEMPMAADAVSPANAVEAADPEAVQRILWNALPALLLYISVDGGKAGSQAVTRAAKRMGLGASATVAAYAVGVPLSVTMGFDRNPLLHLLGFEVRGGGFGVAGLWAGLASSCAILTVVMLMWTMRVDWEREQAKAVRRSTAPSTPDRSGAGDDAACAAEEVESDTAALAIHVAGPTKDDSDLDHDDDIGGDVPGKTLARPSLPESKEEHHTASCERSTLAAALAMEVPLAADGTGMVVEMTELPVVPADAVGDHAGCVVPSNGSTHDRRT